MAKSLERLRSGSLWPREREMVALPSLQKEIDRVFEDFLTPFKGEREAWIFNPEVDVEEAEDHYLISLDLPGVAKDDVKIEINEHDLTISGERKREHEEEGRRSHFMGRSYGRFERTFTLASALDPDKIEANYEAGVLKVYVPKTEATKGRQIKIGEGKSGVFGKLLEGKEKVA